MFSEKKYRDILTADQVTEEILTAAEETHEGWYADEARIDWEDFIDRLDGMMLDDGTYADFGTSYISPAISKIQKHIRAYRKL